MAKYIKNNTESDKTWIGKVVEPDEYYLIPADKELAFANDDTVLVDVANSYAIIAKDDSGDKDITDISTAINYLKDVMVEIDDEGRQVNRIAAASKGWSYLAKPLEFETAKFGSLFSQDYQGNNNTDITINFYDSNDVEVTTPGLLDINEASIVKTVVTFKPNHDYELVSGKMHQQSVPSNDLRVWVVGGILELGASYTKTFVDGINFKYIGADEPVHTDGRASKFMRKDIEGVPYQANQIQFIIKHNAGQKHKLMFILEYFRA